MFSCSRNSLRQNLRKQAPLQPPSCVSEPLIFLYPAWYREQVQWLHHAARTTEKGVDTSQGRETRPVQRRKPSTSATASPALPKSDPTGITASAATGKIPAADTDGGSTLVRKVRPSQQRRTTNQFGVSSPLPESNLPTEAARLHIPEHNVATEGSEEDRESSRPRKTPAEQQRPTESSPLPSGGALRPDSEPLLTAANHSLPGQQWFLRPSKTYRGVVKGLRGIGARSPILTSEAVVRARPVRSSRGAIIIKYDPKNQFRTIPSRSLDEKDPETPSSLTKRLIMTQQYSPKAEAWVWPLKCLEAASRHPSTPDGEIIRLEKEAIYQLTGSFEENIWINHANSGCEVHVIPSSIKSRGSSIYTVLLRGEERARELTKDYLLDFQRRVRRASVKNDAKSEPVYRQVLSESDRHVRGLRFERADSLKKPEVWSIRSFADYVQDLVEMQIPPAIYRELYKSEMSHNECVLLTLEKVFTDVHLASYISTRALNKALAFACRHTERPSTANALYTAVKSMGMNFTIDTFNIMIESTLRLNSPKRFLDMLRDMRSMNIVPNGTTWAKVLPIMGTQDAKRHVLAYMRAANLLESRGTVNAVALELIRTDFLNFARRRDGLEDFWEVMDDLLGKDWFSTKCMNKMLQLCADENEWTIATTVMSMGAERDVRSRSTTLTHLFKLLRKRGCLRESMNILESHAAQIVGWDEKSVIPAVFMAAWKQGFYNVCRVLWHYAATRGMITFVMSKITASSLVDNIGLTDSTNSRSKYSGRTRRAHLAGKIIIGTDVGGKELKKLFPRLSIAFGGSDPIQWLARWTPNDGTREEQLSLAYLMINRDLTAWKKYLPMRRDRLYSLLREAFDQDYSWTIHDALEISPQNDLLQSAITTWLIPRSSGLEDSAASSIATKPLLLAPPGGGQAHPGLPGDEPERQQELEDLIETPITPRTRSQLSLRRSGLDSWQFFARPLRQLTALLMLQSHSNLQFAQRRFVATAALAAPPKSDKVQTHATFQTSTKKKDKPARYTVLKSTTGPRILKYSAPAPVPGPPTNIFISVWRDPQKISAHSLSRVDRLRLRSAFITWNTCEALIRVVKMLDWRTLQIAISLRGEVTRRWYRVGHYNLLLNHIKESYVFGKDLDKFEDLTELKFATTRLSLRSRAIYLHLLRGGPKTSGESEWLKKRIALQAENVRRLGGLIEPFYTEWVSREVNGRGREVMRLGNWKTFLEGREVDFRSIGPPALPERRVEKDQSPSQPRSVRLVDLSDDRLSGEGAG